MQASVFAWDLLEKEIWFEILSLDIDIHKMCCLDESQVSISWGTWSKTLNSLLHIHQFSILLSQIYNGRGNWGTNRKYAWGGGYFLFLQLKLDIN